MLQLIAFEDVYVTEDPASDGLAAYLEGKADEECVVYIDVDSMWGSGFDSGEVLEELFRETDYSAAEPLYRYALSDTYMLTK